MPSSPAHSNLVKYYISLKKEFLADIDEQAEEMFSRPVKQMAEREGVIEKIKATNQLEWVRLMNNICNRATEIVTANLIYN